MPHIRTDPRHEQAIHDALSRLMPDTTFTLDAEGRFTRASGSCVALLRLESDAVRGRPLAELVLPEHAADVRAALARAADGSTQHFSVRCHGGAEAGRYVHLALRGVHVDGALVAYAALAVDLSGTRGALRPAHDALTGLADRMHFRDRVERALARAARGGAPATPSVPAGEEGVALPAPDAHHVAVLFIDLDDFKTVNDSLGHAEGDRLLTEVAARLLKATRGFDLVARLGGDEFGVLLEGMRGERDAQAVIDRIAGLLKRPVQLQGREVIATASIGVAFARDARNADELLRNADIAMYQAKAAGKGRHAEFDQAMHAAAVARLELAADLRFALERDELRLAYQPVIELATGAITGVEALLRWDRGGRGPLPPNTFVPIAEETGLIIPIGAWVLREACGQLARWRTELPAGERLTMNVNVSGRQLTDPEFVPQVLAIVAEAGIPPERLTLEITESVLVERADDVLATMHALRAAGLRLAIDDFGTGYSSLGYLQHFPVDVLKIDRSFVDGVARGASEAALARTIVALGHALGLEAVAEGIELDVQQQALAALGCGHGQGYLFARPLAPVDFARRFADATRAG